MKLILHHLDAIGLTFEVEISRDWFEALQHFIGPFVLLIGSLVLDYSCYVYDLSIMVRLCFFQQM